MGIFKEKFKVDILPQGASLTTPMPAPVATRLSQSAISSKHGLLYVRPSVPQTGRKILVHSFRHEEGDDAGTGAEAGAKSCAGACSGEIKGKMKVLEYSQGRGLGVELGYE